MKRILQLAEIEFDCQNTPRTWNPSMSSISACAAESINSNMGVKSWCLVPAPVCALSSPGSNRNILTDVLHAEVIWVYFVLKRWKAVMQTLINMGMIWDIELLLSISPTRRLARPLLDPPRLCSFCNKMSISPQTVSLAHILDGYLFLGPHSQPIHPPPPHPWGQLGGWSWCQTSIYFKLLRLIWRCICDPHLNEGDIPFDLQVCCKFIEQRLQTRVHNHWWTHFSTFILCISHQISAKTLQSRMKIRRTNDTVNPKLCLSSAA